MQTATIKLNLRFASVDRLRLAEVSNWDGVALAAPRTDFDTLMERPELDRPGIYILLGEPFGDSLPSAYIGEAENLGSRLRNHKGKDFWSTACVFTCKDDSLTKAHVRYLEGKLIAQAKDAGLVEVQNTQPSGSKLPESDQDAMNVFLHWIHQLLPVLGCGILISSVSKATGTATLPMGSVTELADALRALTPKMTGKQREMLTAHYKMPERRVTAGELATAVGYKSFAAANLHYGKLGKMLGQKMKLPAESCHIGVIVDFIRPHEENNPEWIWILKPQVAEAMQKLGWV